jgi:ATP-dependent DNA helicase RecQ
MSSDGAVDRKAASDRKKTHCRDKCEPLEALQRWWGYPDFRPAQADAINAALAKRDALVVLPTGGGKSLCYQIPAACGAGLVLVVSPLIALMDDQVAAARQVGLVAGALHTNISERERRRIREQAVSGELDLLYVSPERLVIGDIMPLIGSRLALVAVDEAHCVSQWGHDFRPEYRQIGPLLEQFPSAPRMALTATATPQVQNDICRQLALRDPKCLIGHVDRANLIYRSFPRHAQTKQVGEVIARHPGEGGIVYAQTRKEVERLAESLKKTGVHCGAYHAGLPAGERAQVQADFVNEKLDVVVATIAFGMGIDRSNVRYVVHANTPKSIEHYQQEAGRAGRDGLPAECVLFYSGADIAMHRRLALKDGPLAPERARALDRQLRGIGRFAVSPICRHRLLSEHFDQPYPPPDSGKTAGPCGACDICLGETKEVPAEDALLIARKIISAVWRTEGRFGAMHVIDVLRGEATDKIARSQHNALSVYGIMRDVPAAAIRAWIDQLIVQGFLMITEDDIYSFLQMTDAGKTLCKESGEVRLSRIGHAAKKAKKARGKEDLAATDQPLFEKLRQLRKLLAQKQGVPPYLVFTDVTLRELAAQRPKSLDDMRSVKGIGEVKLSRYGALFFAVLGGAEPEQVAGCRET